MGYVNFLEGNNTHATQLLQFQLLSTREASGQPPVPPEERNERSRPGSCGHIHGSRKQPKSPKNMWFSSHLKFRFKNYTYILLYPHEKTNGETESLSDKI